MIHVAIMTGDRTPPGGKKLIMGVRASGHAGYAPRGDDIVCAGCTVLMNVLESGVREQLEIPCRVRQDARKGNWEVVWGEKHADDASVFADVVAGIFRMMADQYPDHVDVRYIGEGCEFVW